MQAYYNLKKRAVFEVRQSEFSSLDDILNMEYIKEEKYHPIRNEDLKIKHKIPEEYLEEKREPLTTEESILVKPKETDQNEEPDLEKQILSNIAFSFVK